VAEVIVAPDVGNAIADGVIDSPTNDAHGLIGSSTFVSAMAGPEKAHPVSSAHCAVIQASVTAWGFK
jgi:hypothetical protein